MCVCVWAFWVEEKMVMAILDVQILKILPRRSFSIGYSEHQPEAQLPDYKIEEIE